MLDFAHKFLKVLVFHLVRQRVEERDHVFWVSFNVAKLRINPVELMQAFCRKFG